MKYTKGKWHHGENSNWIGIAGKCIATTYRQTFKSKTNGEYEGCEEMIANAKLIAAAPEMLDFLIGVSKLNQSAREHINEHFFIELELIIKKATE